MADQPAPHAQDQAIAEAILAREAASLPQQFRARAFNAVGPALQTRGEWLRLTSRRSVADAVLVAIKPELDAYLRYESTITWMTTCTSCATVLDNTAQDTERADRAEAALAEARRIHHETCPLARGNVDAGFTCSMCEALGEEQP
ncbi:hypothetical protein [Streptomyces lancefieldiae]|uniref:Uncharacterized protein n=1 Tax=Streptomyces lancefieldiae TaxID=3075520 RepID=A0ABU3AFY8_9ACTN|nr:hypothetical protein [Streptomyces sp. DSM 40712]MDT0608820.1 hypothetical protein [Streptomyces sp. DSM 40712]